MQFCPNVIVEIVSIISIGIILLFLTISISSLLINSLLIKCKTFENTLIKFVLLFTPSFK
jgi:hypothetical protein